jgi:hypothetical protein
MYIRPDDLHDGGLIMLDPIALGDYNAYLAGLERPYSR